MTEYTTSSQAVREYMTSRERTAFWVQNHSPTETQFYSPSTAPVELDGLVPSSPPSEAESSHSVPPKMVLRYGDGRPDIPIPYGEDRTYGPSRSGSKRRSPESVLPHNSHSRSRSGSNGNIDSSQLGRTLSRHHERRDRMPSHLPEEIRVLPSHTQDGPGSSSNRSRSKSLPRNAYSSSQATAVPLHHPSSQPQPTFTTPSMYPPPVPSQMPTPGQQVTFAQPEWHPYAGKRGHPSNSQKHIPPAIVYAPAHHSKPHYSPPAIYSYPPQTGPGGVVYSHSAPVAQTQYPHAGATPYPSAVASSSHLASVNEEMRRSGSRSTRRDRSRSMTLTGDARRSPSASTGSFESNDSGSTYYVIPTAGQKVHIIAPESSIYTSTSTTKTPTSPRSGSIKKPFFRRLFNLADKFSSADSSKASSKSSRRLQRRHSTGGSGRNNANQRAEH